MVILARGRAGDRVPELLRLAVDRDESVDPRLQRTGVTAMRRKWVREARKNIGLFSAVALSIAILAAGGIIYASGGSLAPNPPLSQSTSDPGLIPAPTPAVHSMPSSEQSHYVAGPYISSVQAESLALQIAQRFGTGHATVLTAKLESVAAASADAGQRVASLYTGNDRMVWLVWLEGPYQPLCQVASQCAPIPNTEYFVAVDAKSGQVYGVGYTVNAPGAPKYSGFK